MGAQDHYARRRVGLAGLSRRDILRLAGAGGAAAFLASCTGGVSGNNSDDEATEKPQAYPTGKAQIRWVQTPGAKDAFFKQWFADYQKEHSNITVVNDVMALDELPEVVSLGVQNDNAHDVWIQLPPGVTKGRAVQEGWIAALDDAVPNFEDWKAAFPENTFIDGLNMFDGKIYGCPVSSSRSFGNPFLYNRRYMEDAGYDPMSEQLTWDDWRDAAKKITNAGDGKYFGWVVEGAQTPRLADLVSTLATVAGSGTVLYQGVPFDFSTGEFNATSDEHLAAVELLLAMIDDGSLLRGSMSMNAEQARNQAMVNGDAGTIVQGPWNVEVWQQQFPDFDFGIGALPTPGTPTPVGTSPAPGAEYLLYARSEVKAVAGDMFAYLGSPEGSKAYYDVVGVAAAPVFAEALDDSELNGRQLKVLELNEQLVRMRPEPAVRNLDVEQVLASWQAVEPDLGIQVQGILSGDVDPKEGLQAVQDAANAELDRAIKEAKGDDTIVSRDDFVFSNWDPTQDYLPEHYEEL